MFALSLVLFIIVPQVYAQRVNFYGPDVSKDGQIAFYKLGGEHQIYVCNSDGSNAQPIDYKTTGGNDIEPKWSPNAQSIAFTSYGVDGDNSKSAIYLMNNKGKELKKVVQLENGLAHFGGWIDDNSFLFFHGTSQTHNDIYKFDLQTKTHTKLTESDGQYLRPIWDVHRSKVVFTVQANNKMEIYEMNLDGTERTKLSDGEWSEMFPVVDRQNHRALFTSTQSGSPQIYTFDYQTNELKKVTESTGNIMFPTFLDKTHMIYCAPTPDGYRIKVVNLEDLSESFLFK